jgi:hypothetical protein
MYTHTHTHTHTHTGQLTVESEDSSPIYGPKSIELTEIQKRSGNHIVRQTTATMRMNHVAFRV